MVNNVILHSVSILGRDCAVGHEAGFMSAFVLCFYFFRKRTGQKHYLVSGIEVIEIKQ